MPLFFAYGANLDAPAMLTRCPGARIIAPARLARHRFFIMESGWASVIRDPARSVHGLLWDVPLADVRALDAFEAVDRGLYSKVLQGVIPETGGSRRALVYIGASVKPGRPQTGYMEGVVAAAEAAGLPAAYLRELASHLPGGRARPAPAAIAMAMAGPTARARPRAIPLDPGRVAAM